MPILIENDEPIAKVDPEKEYLSGGSRLPLRGGYASVANRALRITENSGPELADLMLTDEKIGGSVRTIKDGILSQGMQITATVQIDPEDTPDDLTESDLRTAFEVEDHCERAWRGLKNSRIEFLRKMLDAMAYRTMLAEVVRTVAASGPDEGTYLLERISVKDAGTWSFVYDAYGNVRGIQGYTLSPAGQGVQRKIFPREKFVILPWLPRGSHPYGQGLMTEVYNPWNYKVQFFPKLWEYGEMFASPTIHATTPEDAESRIPYAADGTILSDDEKAVPPTVALHRELESFLRNRSRLITTPFGATIEFKTPAGNGAFFQMVLSMLDAAIVYGMHNTTMTLGMQGKRSNDTGAASGQDLLGLVISYGKWALKEMLYRDLWHPHVAYNFGPEVADRFTPEVSFGMTNPEDFSRNSNSITRMYAAGMIVPEERTDALRFLGLTFGRRRRKSDPAAPLSVEPQPGTRPVNVKTSSRAA